MTPDNPSGDSPVLIAYDGSDHAKAAIAQAGEQLRTPEPRSFSPSSSPWRRSPSGELHTRGCPPASPRKLSGRQSDVAHEGADLAREAGFEAEATVTEGSPVWKRIIEVAKEQKPA